MPDEDEANSDDDRMSPAALAALKKELRAAKKGAKASSHEFVAKLAKAREGLSSEQERGLVLAIAHADLGDHLDAYVAAHRHLVVSALESWWGKYASTLASIESERDAARAKTGQFLRELRYE